MIAPLLDHLTAIVVGTVLIVTLLTLQVRDRQSGVLDTINHTVRIQLYEAMDAVDDDVTNLRSPEAAHAFTGTTLSYTWGVDTLATGETAWFTFPAAVLQDTTTQDRVYGQVRYELIPNGDSVTVGGVLQPLHSLVRKVDYSVAAPGQPADLDTLSRSLTSLRMGFVSGVLADSTVWSGAARPTTHSVHLSVTAARPAPEQVSQEQAYTGFDNAVTHGAVYAPRNIR